MPIFQINNTKLTPIKEVKLYLEKDLQKFTEENLEGVFGYEYISSEFSLNNLRIDTLAFDEESSSFVIIEYKKDRSFSVVDQGFAYLALMLNNKADFILEYNEKNQKNLKRGNIDWSQSKVMFLANSFTTYQQKAIHFQDLPIELWEVKKYNNNTILFNQLKSPTTSESIKSISKNKTIEKVSKEVKKYTLDDILKPNWDKTKELFNHFSEKILELDSQIETKPTKSYIGFRIGNKNVINVKPRKSKLIIELLRTKPKDLKDRKNKAQYVKNSYKHFNQHVSLLDIKNEDDIYYARGLIEQVYNKFFK